MKPKLLVLHPKQWAEQKYGQSSDFEIRHVSIGGAIPKKLNGTVTYDGYAQAVTEDGLKNLYFEAERFKPDFFLFWLHAGLYAQHHEIVRAKSPNTKFLFWFGNHRTKLAGNVTNIRKFVDVLFLNSKEPSQFKLYHDYGIKNVATLYDGFEPAEVPLLEVEPKYDCFFAGESYMNAQMKNEVFSFPGTQLRREFILNVAKRYELALHCARKDSWPFKCLPEVYHPKHTDAMRQAKITLNLNHFPMFRQAYTRRTIRSLFARRCHITLYIPGMEEDFENHKHLVWFHSIDEAMVQIDYYLKHEKERESIAWNGWRLACQKFTFEARLQTFAQDIRKFYPEMFER